jgi:hypothetical protein
MITLSKVALYSALALSLLIEPTFAQPVEQTKQVPSNKALSVMKQPVQVELVINDDAAGQEIFGATFRISDGHSVQTVGTYLVSKDSEFNPEHLDILSTAREQVRWQPPYLQISSVQSHKTTWDNSAVVFKFQNGRLSKMGNIGGSEKQFLKEGRFTSLYNKPSVWASMGFQCSACKPHIIIVLDSKNSSFLVNASETWKINGPLREENGQIIRSQLPSGVPKRDEDADFQFRMGVFDALIENAVLAKYCAHHAELTSLLKLAGRDLDKGYRAELDSILLQVVPLELPDAWIGGGP